MNPNLQRVCDHEGCVRGIGTGHALHRISPKGPGQKFVGLCAEHYAGSPNPAAQAIEDSNQRSRAFRDSQPAKEGDRG